MSFSEDVFLDNFGNVPKVHLWDVETDTIIDPLNLLMFHLHVAPFKYNCNLGKIWIKFGSKADKSFFKRRQFATLFAVAFLVFGSYYRQLVSFHILGCFVEELLTRIMLLTFCLSKKNLIRKAATLHSFI